MADLERSTASAVESLGLSQLSELEACNGAIAGDFMDMLDTTELPTAKAWSVLCDTLEEWKKSAREGEGQGDDFWAIVSGGAGMGHKALLAMIHLAIKGGEKGGDAAWLAGRAYLCLLDLPGASAYGVFNGTIFRSVLALMKKVMEAGGGAGDSSKAAAKGKRGAGKKRGAEDEDDEDDDDDSDDASTAGQTRKPRAASKRAPPASKATTAASRGRHVDEPCRLLQAVGASLNGGSLESSLKGHEDLQGELAEVSLAIHAVAAANSPLSIPARDIFLRLLSGSSRPRARSAGNALALHALMPLLTLKTGSGNKSGLPTDARSRTAAHNKAVQLVVALVEEAKRRPEVAMDEDEAEEGEGQSEQNDKAADDDAMDVDQQAEPQEKEAAEEEEEESGDEDEDDEGKGKKGKKAKGAKGGKKKAKTGEVPTSLQLTVLAVLEHMCTEAPDRADTRAKVVDSALVILKSLQDNFPSLGPRFVAFLAKLLRSAKVSHRTLAVELAATFVNTSWAWDTPTSDDNTEQDGKDGVDAAEACALAMEALVRSLSSRVLDKAPSVRARAMVCLSDMLLRLRDERQRAPEGLKTILRSLALPKDGQEGRDLIAMVRSRSHDDKAAVRKAALQALEILLSSFCPSPSAEDIGLFSARCNDVSVLTRKQAMGSLSSLLLHHPTNEALQACWVRCVLPLVSDPEQGILNRLADLFNDVVIERVLAWHKANNATGTSTRPSRAGGAAASEGGEVDGSVWHVLSLTASRDLNKALQSAVTLFLQGGGPNQASTASSAPTPKRLKDLMDALQSAALASIQAEDLDPVARTHLRRGSWALLEALLTCSMATPGSSSSRLVASDPAFVITCWRKVYDSLPDNDHVDRTAIPHDDVALEDDARKILRVLSKLAEDVPAAEGMELAEDLLASLAGLDGKLSPENCGAALDTISALCQAKAPSPEEGVDILTNAATQILEACEAALRAFIVDRKATPIVLARLERATFLTGAVALLGFNPNEEDAKPSDKGGKRKKTTQTAGGVSVIRIPVPDALVAMVRVLLAPDIRPLAVQDADASIMGEEVSSEAPQHQDAMPVPVEVRAHAFLSLGKVCLRDKNLAKENVNLFVRELALSHSPAIRSNALLILGDLCVRYTSLVERHVPAMARCLQDHSPLIRRHAQALISQLLLQDYLKWKGLLLHRYLAVLIDTDPRVAELAEFMLFTQFMRKVPGLFVSHFVESMVVFNDCSDHDSYKAAMAQGAESGTAVTMEGVDLEGDHRAAKRMHIYRAMLQRMSDEQRIQVAAKITQDILSAATDEDDAVAGGIRIQSYQQQGKGKAPHQRRREAALLQKLKRDENLVRDAIAVLRCPDIKVASGSKAAAEGEGDEEGMMVMMEGEGSQDAASAAKGRLLSKVSRKHLLEHVVPTLVSLKACLERAHSPLVRDVMEYFQELMKASREEVKEALSSDPTLFHEIDYDLQQYEKKCAKRAAAEAAARQSMPPPPPKSPGDPLKQRMSIANRRRSSVGSVVVTGPDGRRASMTPLAAALTHAGATGAKLTPVLASCSAPRLRRSSIGVPGGAAAAALLTRTPAEAVRAALLPMDELQSPQPLTPVPRNGRGSPDGSEATAEKSEPMKVQLPEAIKAWNVTVQASPLDKENRSSSRANQSQSPPGAHEPEDKMDEEEEEAPVVKKGGRATRTAATKATKTTTAAAKKTTTAKAAKEPAAPKTKAKPAPATGGAGPSTRPRRKATTN